MKQMPPSKRKQEGQLSDKSFDLNFEETKNMFHLL